MTCLTISQGSSLCLRWRPFWVCAWQEFSELSPALLRHEHHSREFRHHSLLCERPRSFNVMFFEGWSWSGRHMTFLRWETMLWLLAARHRSCELRLYDPSWQHVLKILLLPVHRSQDKLSLALERVELQSEEATFFQKQTNDKILLIKVRGRELVLAENLPTPSSTRSVCSHGTSRTCILTPPPVLDDKAMTDEPPCCVTSSWHDELLVSTVETWGLTHTGNYHYINIIISNSLPGFTVAVHSVVDSRTQVHDVTQPHPNSADTCFLNFRPSPQSLRCEKLGEAKSVLPFGKNKPYLTCFFFANVLLLSHECIILTSHTHTGRDNTQLTEFFLHINLTSFTCTPSVWVCVFMFEIDCPALSVCRTSVLSHPTLSEGVGRARAWAHIFPCTHVSALPGRC